MKRVLCLVPVLVLLLGSTAYAHDDHSSGPEVKAYKALPLWTLPDLAVTVNPSFPQLDNSLAFDRVDPGTSLGQVATVSPERLHYRLIDAGRGSSTIRTITS